MIPHVGVLIDRLKKELNPSSDCDDVLYYLLESAFAYVQTETNRWWGITEETTDYLIGDGTRNLYLQSRPVLDPGSGGQITVTEQLLPSGSADLLTASAYALRRAPRFVWLVRTDGNIWKCGAEYVVQYEHGYSEDPLPEDIVQVIVALVQRRWLNDQAQGIQREQIDNYSYSRSGADDMVSMDHEKAILETWREPVFA